MLQLTILSYLVSTVAQTKYKKNSSELLGQSTGAPVAEPRRAHSLGLKASLTPWGAPGGQSSAPESSPDEEDSSPSLLTSGIGQSLDIREEDLLGRWPRLLPQGTF